MTELKNGYVKWNVLIWILGGLITFAGFTYAIRVDSSNKQFSNEDAKIEALTNTLNKHLEAQNINEKLTASALGRIEESIKRIK